MLQRTITPMLQRTIMLALGLALAGCFSVDEPPCSYACSDTGLCPDDYQCLSDGYCHLHGQMTSCGYTDAALAPGDLANASTADGGSEGGVVDLSMPIEIDMAMTLESDLAISPAADLSTAPTPSPSPSPSPTPSPTPSPSPSPSPTPAPAITAIGPATAVLFGTSTNVPLAVTPSPAPSPEPTGSSVTVSEFITPPSAVTAVKLTYDIGAGAVTQSMSYVATAAGQDQYSATIPASSGQNVTFSIEVDGFYSDATIDPVSGSYIYATQ